MENLISRKNIRLKEYDYSKEGCYFITICTKNRECILSKVANIGALLTGDPQKVTLHQEGEIVKKHIEICNCKCNNFSINEYIIMPNHVHLIIIIERVAQECNPYNS